MIRTFRSNTRWRWALNNPPTLCQDVVEWWTESGMITLKKEVFFNGFRNGYAGARSSRQGTN